MILFIRKIPFNTLPSELHDFVGPALKGGLFFQSGRILKAGILISHDKASEKIQFHGYVHIDSEKVGWRAIKKLNGKRFKNRLVIVREYKNRSWHNDRRLDALYVPQEILDKRVKDRRRGNAIDLDYKNMSFIQMN